MQACLSAATTCLMSSMACHNDAFPHIRARICRLAEEEIIRQITITDATITRTKALLLVQSWFLTSPTRFGQEMISPLEGIVLDVRRAGDVEPSQAHRWCSDTLFLAWAESVGASVIASQLKVRPACSGRLTCCLAVSLLQTSASHAL